MSVSTAATLPFLINSDHLMDVFSIAGYFDDNYQLCLRIEALQSTRLIITPTCAVPWGGLDRCLPTDPYLSLFIFFTILI